jgi:hypothetical protein
MNIAPFLFRASAAFASFTLPVLPLASLSAFAVDPSFNGEAVTTLGDASRLAIAENKVSGSGSFVYGTKLDVIGPDSSHALTFSIKDGGQLSFVAYADPSLGQGLSFDFVREGTVLKGFIVKNGDLTSALEISSELSNINAARIINLQIDVHNAESPSHLLVWDGLESEFSEDKALVNTEEIDAGSPGNGAGSRRGFVLRDATLLKALASEAKFGH